MRARKIPVKNIVKEALRYAGEDVVKLQAIYDFLSNLVELKLERMSDSMIDKEISFPDQKKVELKVDEKVEKFLSISESIGKSASGLLCEVMKEIAGLEIELHVRKPRAKKVGGKTVSLKIPKKLYKLIEEKNKGRVLFSSLVRNAIDYFLENPMRFSVVSRWEEEKSKYKKNGKR